MSRRKRILLTSASLTCLGLAGLAILVMHATDSPINPENFARIRPGMTEPEVAAIFGPPDDHGDGFQLWSGSNWVATIYFDKEGRVGASMFGPQQSLLRRLRSWFRL